jgi:hypothetical protein
VTAILILSLIGLAAFVFLIAGIVNVRQSKVGPLTKTIKSQRKLILEIEKEAIQFGYADPLGQIVLSKIYDARQEENK